MVDSSERREAAAKAKPGIGEPRLIIDPDPQHEVRAGSDRTGPPSGSGARQQQLDVVTQSLQPRMQEEIVLKADMSSLVRGVAVGPAAAGRSSVSNDVG